MQYRKSAARWQQSLIFSRLQRCISGASHLSDGHDEAGLIMWSLTSPFTVLVSRINDLLLHIDFIFSSCILGYIFLELSAFFFLLHVHLDTLCKRKKKRKEMPWTDCLKQPSDVWGRILASKQGHCSECDPLTRCSEEEEKKGALHDQCRERERHIQTEREREGGEKEREREWVSQLLSVFSAEEPESSLAASPETQTRYVSNRLLQVGEVIPVTRLGASQTHTASLIWSVCLTCLNIQSALLGCKASPSNWDACGCRWRCWKCCPVNDTGCGAETKQLQSAVWQFFIYKKKRIQLFPVSVCDAFRGKSWRHSCRLK